MTKLERANNNLSALVEKLKSVGGFATATSFDSIDGYATVGFGDVKFELVRRKPAITSIVSADKLSKSQDVARVFENIVRKYIELLESRIDSELNRNKELAEELAKMYNDAEDEV